MKFWPHQLVLLVFRLAPVTQEGVYDFLSKIDFCALGHAEFCRKYGTAWHNGEDWSKVGGGIFGDPVKVVANGKVITSGKWGGCFGHIVMAEHVPPSGVKFTLPDGRKVKKVWSNYNHMSARLVSAGQNISKGQKVGKIGTGGCWAPHLHWAIRYRYLSATANTLNFRKDQILYYFVDPSDFINKNRRVECYLVRKTGTAAVYFVEKGKKRGIPNATTFTQGLRFRWGDICDLDSLAAYPTGPPVPDVTHSWVASHFSGRNISLPPVVIRGDELSHGIFTKNWGYGSPDPSIDEDNFSSRYVTRYYFDAGTHTFKFVSDDGLRVWIDDTKLIDAWVDQARSFEFKYSLSRGYHYIRVEHFEGYVTSYLKVNWERSDWFTLIIKPVTQAIIEIKRVVGLGLQIIVDGVGGVYKWLTDAYAAIKLKAPIFFRSPVFVSWEQFDKDYTLILAFLIEGQDGKDRLLSYAANAPDRWDQVGYVDISPHQPTYNQWETFTRNLESDYLDEFGVAPEVLTEIRIGHAVNDGWVGDHGGTIQNITFVEEIAAPVTTISFDPPEPNGENNWYVSNVTATLSATSPLGIERTEYNLGAGWVTYTVPFTISQEGIVKILCRSIDRAGNVEPEKTAIVNLDKSPPVVVIGGPYPGEEGSAVEFDGSSSYDAVSGIQSYLWGFAPAVEGQETSQPSVSASYTWGDNGEFGASLSVKDMAGWVAEDDTPVPITNVSPIITLDRSTMILFPAEEAFLTKVGQSFALGGNVTDPGSDDLELTFDFDNGSAGSSQTFLNDPEVGPDPSPSPEINPRDVTASASHNYQNPGVYQPFLTATDDDSGESSDQDYTVVQDDGSVGIRTTGFWKYQFGVGEGIGNLIPQTTLERYLAIADFLTDVFTDLTFTQAQEILGIPDASSMQEKAKAQYLALLFNFASGSIDWNQQVDTDFDGISDTILLEAVFEIDAALSDPDSTDAELEAVKDIADSINNMGE